MDGGFGIDGAALFGILGGLGIDGAALFGKDGAELLGIGGALSFFPNEVCFGDG